MCGKQVGTFSWAAPEVLLGQQCSEKVDIYSYGVLLWELSAGEAPAGRQLRKLQYVLPCVSSSGVSAALYSLPCSACPFVYMAFPCARVHAHNQRLWRCNLQGSQPANRCPGIH